MVSSCILARFLLLALLPAINCFTFTGPDPSQPLNLTVPGRINITWDPSDTPYSAVDISWHGQGPSGDGFSYTLIQNLSVSNGAYYWFTVKTIPTLQDSKLQLSADAVFTFEAMLHNNDSLAGATVTSDMYKVTGYQYIGAAAALRQPSLFALSLGLVLIAWMSS